MHVVQDDRDFKVRKQIEVGEKARATELTRRTIDDNTVVVSASQVSFERSPVVPTLVVPDALGDAGELAVSFSVEFDGDVDIGDPVCVGFDEAGVMLDADYVVAQACPLKGAIP